MIEASQTNFPGDIGKNGKTLVVVSAPGCGPCEIMKKKVLPNVKTKTVVVNAAENQHAMQAIQAECGSILSVPTSILYEDGYFSAKHSGLMMLEDLNKFIGE